MNRVALRPGGAHAVGGPRRYGAMGPQLDPLGRPR